MTKKLKVAIIAALALVCVIFTACIIQHELPPRAAPWGTPNSNTGDFEGSAPGYQSDIEVTIRLVNGNIVEVEIDVSRETTIFMNMNNLPQALEERVLATNSFDFTPDAFSAPTTVRAARDAGRAALLSIPGVPPDYFE
jgi:hypothetical protein